MEDYSEIFNNHWRGRDFIKPWHVSIIQNSHAKSFRELCGECEIIMRESLSNGNKFYEPSTYYGSFRPAHTHEDVEWAARRLTSEIFSSYSRYLGHKCKDIRPLPEEMSEYDLKIWCISHPHPLTESVRQLWKLTNKMAAIEPWAWPIIIGLEGTQYMPDKMNMDVFKGIMEMFFDLGYTEDDFFKAHSELWNLFNWVSAKGL